MRSFFQALVLTSLVGGTASAMAKDLVVAQVAPFGGNLAVAGRDFNLGVPIAFDEINSNGGIGGQRIRLVSRDDGHRPDETVRHVVALLETEDPIALIGLWGADSAQALISNKTLERSGLPVVGVRSGDASLRKQALLFHVRASFRDEVSRMVAQVSAMGISRVAVVHEDEPFAREALAVARESLQARTIELAAVAQVQRDSLTVDFGPGRHQGSHFVDLSVISAEGRGLQRTPSFVGRGVGSSPATGTVGVSMTSRHGWRASSLNSPPKGLA